MTQQADSDKRGWTRHAPEANSGPRGMVLLLMMLAPLAKCDSPSHRVATASSRSSARLPVLDPRGRFGATGRPIEIARLRCRRRWPRRPPPRGSQFLVPLHVVVGGMTRTCMSPN